MSRDIHLLVDETGGAYPANLESAPATIRRRAPDRPSHRAYLSNCATYCRQRGESSTRMCPRLSGEEFAGYRAPGRERQGQSRTVVDAFGCRAWDETTRTPGSGRKGC